MGSNMARSFNIRLLAISGARVLPMGPDSVVVVQFISSRVQQVVQQLHSNSSSRQSTISSCAGLLGQKAASRDPTSSFPFSRMLLACRLPSSTGTSPVRPLNAEGMERVRQFFPKLQVVA